MIEYKLKIGSENSEKIQKKLSSKIWPEFMQHDIVVNKFWTDLFNKFSDFQFSLVHNSSTIGIGNSIHLHWVKPFDELPDNGIDWAIEKGFRDLKSNVKSNLLIGLQISVDKNYQGLGLSTKLLQIIKDISKNHGIDNLAIPVRPILKSKFPLVPMNDYIKWSKEDGLPYDPWIRLHVKAGGRIIKPCNKAMTISGSISDWESWTEHDFPGTGQYIIEGALVPIMIDKEKNIGEYIEPNVWMLHTVK